jgi:hypothetical protein
MVPRARASQRRFHFTQHLQTDTRVDNHYNAAGIA